MGVAVNRLTTSGRVLGPGQRITPNQVLAAYTSDAATVLGIEDQVGTFEPDKYAEFVVLSENPSGIDPTKVKDIRVEATVMNGRITYYASTKGFYQHWPQARREGSPNFTAAIRNGLAVVMATTGQERWGGNIMEELALDSSET